MCTSAPSSTPSADGRQVPPPRDRQPLVERGGAGRRRRGGRVVIAARTPRVTSPAVAGPVDAPPYEPPTRTTRPSTGSTRPAVEVLLTRVDDSVPVPAYAHPGDAGVDLSCTDGRRARRPASASLVGTGRRGRAAAGLRRLRAPPLGARGAGRALGGQHARHRRRGLPRRDPRLPDQPRSARGAAAAAAATGSRSWWCSASSRSGSSRSRPFPGPREVPVATAPPAGTPVFPGDARDGTAWSRRRVRAGRSRRQAVGRRR